MGVFARMMFAPLMLAALLAGCGGGGGGSAAPVPVSTAVPGAGLTPAPIVSATPTPSAQAGISAFAAAGTSLEDFLAPSSSYAILTVASAARPQPIASPSAPAFTGTIDVESATGLSTFALQRATALQVRRTIDVRSLAAAPAGGEFRADHPHMLDLTRLQPAAPPAIHRARAQAVPAVGSTRSWNLLIGGVGGAAFTNQAVSMTLIAASAHALIWLDTSLGSYIAPGSANATLLGRMFDNVYVSDTALFGSADYTDAAPGVKSYATCDQSGATQTGTSDQIWIEDTTPGVINVLLPLESTLGPAEGGYFTSADFANQDIANCSNGNGVTYVSNQAPTVVVGATTPELSELNTPNYPNYIRSGMAHELQHLIHFVNHAILNGGSGEDPSWLNEGMSMVAEDLTTASGIDVAGTPYAANAFLYNPQNYSLTAFTGYEYGTYTNSCIGCYGHAYLFMRYIADRFGTGIMQKLTQTSLTGANNLATATGVDFATLVSDFDTALAINGHGIASSAAGSRYALAVPIGQSYTAGSEQLNGTVTYAALGTVATLAIPGGLTFNNAVEGAPIFVKVGSAPGTGGAIKITDDTGTGAFALDPTLSQR